MLILVIIAVILLVSYGLNMYVEENNKEVTFVTNFTKLKMFHVLQCFT